jgi:DNA-binding NarL/FixJ family response regulator
MTRISFLAQLRNRILPSGDLKGLHCLIIDDDQSFRALFESMLRKLEIGRVTVGRSAADARGIFANLHRPVDLVMCDFSMEGDTGLDLLRSIRLGELKNAKPETSFVMVTGSRTPNLVRLAAALDVNGYLAKPFSFNALKRSILRAIKKPIVPDPTRYRQVPVSAIQIQKDTIHK